MTSPTGRTRGEVEALGLTCGVTWDDIAPEQYCEYRCAPDGVWAAAKYSADVVRQLQREQFGKYLQTWRDIVVRKEDCGATARALAERGPPGWVADEGGLPLEPSQSHVDRLWFMGDEAAAPVSAALHGAPVDPTGRAGLAELHRQVYAYFSEAAVDGTAAPLPECRPEKLLTPGCSQQVREHVLWMQDRFEPMRGAGAGTAHGSPQPQIGTKIPKKYHSAKRKGGKRKARTPAPQQPEPKPEPEPEPEPEPAATRSQRPAARPNARGHVSQRPASLRARMVSVGLAAVAVLLAAAGSGFLYRLLRGALPGPASLGPASSVAASMVDDFLRFRQRPGR